MFVPKIPCRPPGVGEESSSSAADADASDASPSGPAAAFAAFAAETSEYEVLQRHQAPMPKVHWLEQQENRNTMDGSVGETMDELATLGFANSP